MSDQRNRAQELHLRVHMHTVLKQFEVRCDLLGEWREVEVYDGVTVRSYNLVPVSRRERERVEVLREISRPREGIVQVLTQRDQ